MKRNRALVVAFVLLLALASIASAAPYPSFFFNGFEDPADVGDADRFITVDRVASGTNGVASAAGDWHALADATEFGSPDGFVFTRYGGYSSVFPDGGYTTSIDIFLDMSLSTGGNDLRMDWSSAINQPDGNHRRDFIFAIGTDGAGAFVMSASNNAPGWPANPARDPLTVSQSGWYTFQHRFYDDGSGVLAVEMSVLDSNGTVLKSWTLSDASDVIGATVGGNRYGWLVTSDFNDLPLDNVRRSGAVAKTKDDCKNGGWQNVFRADGSAFKNQGDCIQYVNTGK